MVVAHLPFLGGASVHAPAPPERLRRREGASRLVSSFLAPPNGDDARQMGDLRPCGFMAQ